VGHAEPHGQAHRQQDGLVAASHAPDREGEPAVPHLGKVTDKLGNCVSPGVFLLEQNENIRVDPCQAPLAPQALTVGIKPETICCFLDNCRWLGWFRV
jgi:hypothetical protein